MFANSLVMQLALKAYPDSGYEELKLQTQSDANTLFSLPKATQMSSPDFKNLSDRLLRF